MQDTKEAIDELAINFREDGEYKDNRHPEEVKFVEDIYGDLSRRDFTINAMAKNTFDNNIIDYFNGNCSLEKAIDDIKLNTRHYAKRQITYFKKLNIKMLKPQSVEQMAEQIVSELKKDKL